MTPYLILMLLTAGRSASSMSQISGHVGEDVKYPSTDITVLRTKGTKSTLSEFIGNAITIDGRFNERNKALLKIAKQR